MATESFYYRGMTTSEETAIFVRAYSVMPRRFESPQISITLLSASAILTETIYGTVTRVSRKPFSRLGFPNKKKIQKTFFHPSRRTSTQLSGAIFFIFKPMFTTQTVRRR